MHYPKYNFSNFIENRQNELFREILDLDDEKLSANSIKEISEYFISRFRIGEIRILKENTSTKLEKSREIINKSYYAAQAECAVATYVLPIENGKLMDFLPSTYSTYGGRIFNEEIATIYDEKIVFRIIKEISTLKGVSNPKEVFEGVYKSELSRIEAIADNLNKMIRQHNNIIETQIPSRVETRIKKYQEECEIFSLIDIEVHPQGNSNTGKKLIPITVVKRELKTNSLQNGCTNNTFAISDESYDLITNVIRRHIAATEKNPKDIQTLKLEESIRNTYLWALNSNFEIKNATGEAFRKNGKTDICIEEENKSAFIAECKIWKGEKEFLEAFDQLFGYATWKDAKLAIILFNLNNKGVQDLNNKIYSTLCQNEKIVKVNKISDTEWQCYFKTEYSDVETILVTVFVAHYV